MMFAVTGKVVYDQLYGDITENVSFWGKYFPHNFLTKFPQQKQVSSILSPSKMTSM